MRYLRVFERVAGARIEGSAPPGAEVSAQLEVWSASRGGSGSYRRVARASDGGVYSLRVAYANGAPDPIRTAERYTLRCGGSGAVSGSILVPEEAVVTGAVVAGPALDCD